MSVLTNGYGSPFFQIYYPVVDVNTKKVSYELLPEAYTPTEFEYKFSEEEEDTAKITIISMDRTIADRPFFQEGQPLKCIWGYIGGLTAKAQLVYIRDIDPLIFSDTVKITLLCTDKASFMKDSYSPKVHTSGTGGEDDEFTVFTILRDFCRKYGLKLRIFTQEFDFALDPLNPEEDTFWGAYPNTQPSGTTSNTSLIYEDKVASNKAEFLAKVRVVSSNLGIDPNWLMAVINFESAGTFMASKQNSIGATGLIQFMPDTARGLGTTTAALARMTNVKQLDYVEAYYQPYKSRIKSFHDLYLAIFLPVAIGKPDDHVLRTHSLTPQEIWEDNPAFHNPAHHKYITVGDVRKRVEPQLWPVNSQAPNQYKLIPTIPESIPKDQAEIFKKILDTFIKYKFYPQANKSDWLLLWEMLKKQPGGPWLVYGRGDTLNVGKRDLDKAPFRTYTFGEEPHELLGVELKVKGTLNESETEAIATTHWDAKNKTLTYQATDSITTEDSKLNSFVKNAALKVWNQVNGDTFDKASKVWMGTQAAAYGAKRLLGYTFRGFSFLESLLLTIGVKVLTEEITPDSELKQGSIVRNNWIEGYDRVNDLSTNDKRVYQKKIYYPSGAVIIKQITTRKGAAPGTVFVDNITFKGDTASTLKQVELINKLKNSNLDLTKLPSVVRDVLGGVLQHSREKDAASAKAEIENRKKELDLEKVQLNICLLPHPQLTDGEILTILGIGNKYSGNYYIKECTHKLTDTSYTLTADVYSNAQGKGDKNTGNLDPSTSLPGTINTQEGPTSSGPELVRLQNISPLNPIIPIDQ